MNKNTQKNNLVFKIILKLLFISLVLTLGFFGISEYFNEEDSPKENTTIEIKLISEGIQFTPYGVMCIEHPLPFSKE